jgi:hypothetical protein
MNTMYDPDSRTIKRGPLLTFLFVVGAGAFGPANFPECIWLYFGFAILMFLYTLYVIYCCESFTSFTLGMFSSFVFSFGVAAAGLAHVTLVIDVRASRSEAAVANIGLIALMALIYAFVYFSPRKHFPFQIEGNKVSRVATRRRDYSPGLIAGIGTVASALLISSVSSLTSSAVAVLGVFFGCVALMLYERDAIRGLRTLRIQEKTSSVLFTFKQIEEIREARNRWWISRLFKWVSSRRKSPSD